MLAAGGNAWDAAVAAGFAATAAEPLYTSLAGGGFLLATGPGLGSILFDFFVSVPGLGRTRPVEAPVPVPIRFGAATQTFHVGPGSVALEADAAKWAGKLDGQGKSDLAEPDNGDVHLSPSCRLTGVDPVRRVS